MAKAKAKEIKVEQEARLNGEAYRNALTPEQLAQVPQNQADEAELDDAELDGVDGGGVSLGLRKSGGSKDK